MALVQRRPPPPTPPPSSSGKHPPLGHSPPEPQHAAIPIRPESPPVQETSGSSQTLHHPEATSAPPLQNRSQFQASQDRTGHEASYGTEENKHLPVQETDPAPQALGQQTSESRVPNEANPQMGETEEEGLP